MTTISTSTSTLSSLAALYASENDAGTATGSAATGSGGGLSSDQIVSLASIIEGGSSTGTTGLDTLLGQSPETGAGNLSSIIDAIQAQTTAASSTNGGTTASAATTATADQQKAAAMMQSLYATQQANLFTLLG